MQRLTFLLLILAFSIIKSFGQNELIKTVYFRTNSYEIDKNFKDSLDIIADACLKDTSFYIKIIGYADTTGSEEYNDDLSEKRANAVHNYLQSKFTINQRRN